MSWPRPAGSPRLKAGLSRSSSSLTERIAAVVSRRKLDAATIEELEETLIMADLGVETSALLVKEVARTGSGARSPTSRSARRWRWPWRGSWSQSPSRCLTGPGSGRRWCWCAA